MSAPGRSAPCASGTRPASRAAAWSRHISNARRLDLDAEIANRVIRFHPNCPWTDDDGASIRVPAMIALFRDIRSDAPGAIHRTRLLDGRKHGSPRMLGPVANAAVKLDPDDAVTSGLFVGEGVETVLRRARSTYAQPGPWAARQRWIVSRCSPVSMPSRSSRNIVPSTPLPSRSAARDGGRPGAKSSSSSRAWARTSTRRCNNAGAAMASDDIGTFKPFVLDGGEAAADGEIAPDRRRCRSSTSLLGGPRCRRRRVGRPRDHPLATADDALGTWRDRQVDHLLQETVAHPLAPRLARPAGRAWARASISAAKTRKMSSIGGRRHPRLLRRELQDVARDLHLMSLAGEDALLGVPDRSGQIVATPCSTAFCKPQATSSQADRSRQLSRRVRRQRDQPHASAPIHRPPAQARHSRQQRRHPTRASEPHRHELRHGPVGLDPLAQRHAGAHVSEKPDACGRRATSRHGPTRAELQEEQLRPDHAQHHAALPQRPLRPRR